MNIVPEIVAISRMERRAQRGGRGILRPLHTCPDEGEPFDAIVLATGEQVRVEQHPSLDEEDRYVSSSRTYSAAEMQGWVDYSDPSERPVWPDAEYPRTDRQDRAAYHADEESRDGFELYDGGMK